MSFISSIVRLASASREFFWPSYRPERHYMRGPGPACARRRVAASRASSADGFRGMIAAE
ncbi:MAG: hypothetical protein MEQ84_03915 [Mesorhizobium sp.]|nr:hypothetical protein [Mesorhizobium sp.]